jgi:predicted metal-binding membrane protein
MAAEQQRIAYMNGLRVRQAVVATIVLIIVVALGWYFTARQAEGTDGMAGTMGMTLGPFLVMWLPMVVAMMFLTVGASAVTAVVGERAGRELPARATAFLLAYLAVWMSFGLLVYLVLAGAARIVSIPQENQKWLAAGVYLVAGVYQFLPAKDRCRELCRTTRCTWPNGAPTPAARYGDIVRTAVRHGLSCIGCCAGFMVVVIAVGMTNFLAMALLTVVIFAERFFYPRTVTRVAGVLLLAAAVLTPFVSWLHPGLPGPDTGDAPMM